MLKIALASENPNGLDAPLGKHFGRAPFYTLVEVDSDRKFVSVASVPNPCVGAHQPGMAPQFLQQQGAKVIIAGGVGARAIAMFADYGIEVVSGVAGRVRDILEAYLENLISGVVPCKHDHPDSCGGSH